MNSTVATGQALIYDADCGFCTRSARWLEQGQAFRAVSWQAVDDLAPLGLTEQMVSAAAYWTEDGTVVAAGPRAIASALRSRPGWRRTVGVVIDLAPVRPLARVVYRLVATNRHAMPGGTDACRLPPTP